MSRPLGALLDLLFPPRCVFCRRLLHRGEEGICPRCQQELPWALGAEAEQTGEFFSLCASPLWYQDQVRASFHRYKFKGVRGYSRTYGRLVAQCVQDHLAGRYDLITWVPLSRARLRQRGYDQAMLLASAAALALDDVAAETLCKVRDTEAQSGLGKNDASRRANVLSAYQVTDPALVEGRRVLLIDDIVTTGSTLSECARVLRTAGATDVVCAALARSRRSC
ncbi:MULTISPECIES: ComF family protein [Intestinimonas]|jgi:ComF family protein|uniref:ComF family protein n=1 Tax=Intestinimonas TaxID=1392389 RepID=UPI00067EA068|nr:MULTISPECIES: ComF family protein [Intestinimonas]MBS6283713.1 ComF family protein [Oscillospiraceae bacterium]BDE86423.1 amidophosphoribosyltransferase [Oscillospiraceae bacterium]CUQ40557.1 phosphoribosyltransferase [Flavonifractor plautii]SCI76871.1 DNA utilization protein GntX [uncultured Flavonifractor sp.]